MHAKVFQAVHVERLPLSTDAGIQTWIEKQGVDKTKFADTFKSFGVASKVKRAVQLQNDFKIVRRSLIGCGWQVLHPWHIGR
jgi:thiol:disulfide interchange protein DsbA